MISPNLCLPSPDRPLPVGTVVTPESAALVADPIRALVPALERKLLERCGRAAPYRIEARIVPPEAVLTLESLGSGSEDLRDHAGALIGQRIPVSGEHSTRTIWSCPDVNALFRAWHDHAHGLLAAGFDERGEWRVARHNVAELASTPLERAVMEAETWWQVREYFDTGAFPSDQRAFVSRRAIERLAEWEESAR